MHFLRRRLRPLTWIALAAMLGLALLPAVSHALARAAGSVDWAEVCTASGPTRLAVPGSPIEPGGPSTLAGLQHCAYCTGGTPALGLPPAPLQTWPAPSAMRETPAAAWPRPALAAAWSAAQPRAPPASR